MLEKWSQNMNLQVIFTIDPTWYKKKPWQGVSLILLYPWPFTEIILLKPEQGGSLILLYPWLFAQIILQKPWQGVGLILLYPWPFKEKNLLKPGQGVSLMLLYPWPFTEIILLKPEQGVGLILLRGGKRVTAFKGTSRKFFYFSLDLVDLATSCFQICISDAVVRLRSRTAYKAPVIFYFFLDFILHIDLES
jgi:hypothetical protein